jgi:hypothetical protein
MFYPVAPDPQRPWCCFLSSPKLRPNYVDYAGYFAAFSQIRTPVKWPDAIPNLQPRDDIWPTDRASVVWRRQERAVVARLPDRSAGPMGARTQGGGYSSFVQYSGPST